MECDVNIKQSVMCVDSLHWWYNHAADAVPPSRPLAFVTKKKLKKCKSTIPTAIQMKNQQKTICTEEKLDIISQPENCEQIF